MLTMADKGGRGGLDPPIFGWHNLWTAPYWTFSTVCPLFLLALSLHLPPSVAPEGVTVSGSARVRAGQEVHLTCKSTRRWLITLHPWLQTLLSPSVPASSLHWTVTQGDQTVQHTPGDQVNWQLSYSSFSPFLLPRWSSWRMAASPHTPISHSRWAMSSRLGFSLLGF